LALPGLEGLQIILTIPSLINPISYFIWNENSFEEIEFWQSTPSKLQENNADLIEAYRNGLKMKPVVANVLKHHQTPNYETKLGDFKFDASIGGNRMDRTASTNQSQTVNFSTAWNF
jgi:hypothetical protein